MVLRCVFLLLVIAIVARTGTTLEAMARKQEILECEVVSVGIHAQCMAYLRGEARTEAFTERMDICLQTRGYRELSACTRQSWVRR